MPERQKARKSRLESLEASDKAAISELQATGWKKQLQEALFEARRLNDQETARRQGADTKAATYLVLVGALMPLLATLDGIWTDGLKGAPNWASLPLVLVATLYLFAAGYWAIETLRVSITHRVDSDELQRAWRERGDPRRRLVIDLLSAARLNRNGVNDKVSKIRLSHEHLLRSFVCFAAIIVLEICWPVVESGLSQLPALNVWVQELFGG